MGSGSLWSLGSLVVVAGLAASASAQGLPSGGDLVDGTGGHSLRTGVRPTENVLPDIVLTRLTDEIGLTDTYTEGNTHMGGTAWVDYNGDYWPDLFITNGEGLDHYLYRNEGDGTFTDVSSIIPKPDLMLEGAGVMFGDIDNDDDEDILVYVDSGFFSLTLENPPEGGPNLLYLNSGHNSFQEIAVSSGLVDPRGWRNSAGGLADYDNDSFLDVFLGVFIPNSPDGPVNYDRLLRNKGDLSFEDVTEESHVDSYGRNTLTNLWFDCNLDGWMDLYLGHPIPDSHPEQINGNDLIMVNDPDVPWFWDFSGDTNKIWNDAKAPMGADVGDIDADGDWELYITDVLAYGPEPFGNVLYKGNGDGSFQDNVADVAGVASLTSWPCNFADFDLDGWTDLWVGTNNVNDPDFIYRNAKDGTFTDASPEDFIGNGARGGSIADYDGDGDMDIVIWRQEQNTAIFRNDTDAGPNRWVEFKLHGNPSNRSAIGALVRVTANGITQMRRVSGGDSAHSQMDLIVHFGVSEATTVDVAVDWPSGGQSSFDDLKTNRLHFIDETIGLKPEAYVLVYAEWDQSDQTLLVRTKGTHGGRVKHHAVGFGPMDYSAAKGGFETTFTGVTSNPLSVTVTSTSGASWTFPVQGVP